jgi:hypothetical protein
VLVAVGREEKNLRVAQMGFQEYLRSLKEERRVFDKTESVFRETRCGSQQLRKQNIQSARFRVASLALLEFQEFVSGTERRLKRENLKNWQRFQFLRM